MIANFLSAFTTFHEQKVISLLTFTLFPCQVNELVRCARREEESKWRASCASSEWRVARPLSGHTRADQGRGGVRSRRMTQPSDQSSCCSPSNSTRHKIHALSALGKEKRAFNFLQILRQKLHSRPMSPALATGREPMESVARLAFVREPAAASLPSS